MNPLASFFPSRYPFASHLTPLWDSSLFGSINFLNLFLFFPCSRWPVRMTEKQNLFPTLWNWKCSLFCAEFWAASSHPEVYKRWSMRWVTLKRSSDQFKKNGFVEVLVVNLLKMFKFVAVNVILALVAAVVLGRPQVDYGQQRPTSYAAEAKAPITIVSYSQSGDSKGWKMK